MSSAFLCFPYDTISGYFNLHALGLSSIVNIFATSIYLFFFANPVAGTFWLPVTQTFICSV